MEENPRSAPHHPWPSLSRQAIPNNVPRLGYGSGLRLRLSLIGCYYKSLRHIESRHGLLLPAISRPISLISDDGREGRGE